MNKNLGAWSDEEVKALFKFVEVKKSEGVPLIKIFDLYARATYRHKNSVRNYYYSEILRLSDDPNRARELGIDLLNHKAKDVKQFSEADTQNLLNSINGLIEQGYSVRGACLKLSNGDASKMIRLQNKYRMETKYKKEAKMGTIIKMPERKSIISDEEINALFLGLIKLVRRQEREKNSSERTDDANQKLKEALASIIVKKQEIEKLKQQIQILKKENNEIKETLSIERSKNVEGSVGISAQSAIRQFVKTKSPKLNNIEKVRKV